MCLVLTHSNVDLKVIVNYQLATASSTAPPIEIYFINNDKLIAHIF